MKHSPNAEYAQCARNRPLMVKRGGRWERARGLASIEEAWNLLKSAGIRCELIRKSPRGGYELLVDWPGPCPHCDGSGADPASPDLMADCPSCKGGGLAPE
jgi:hypothetical protein